MDGRYELERMEAEMTVEELLSQYYDAEYFETFCRKCRNYGRLWSCPPYDFVPGKYLKNYGSLRILCTKIRLSDEWREEIITPESMEEAMESIIAQVKSDTDRRLLDEEREQAGRRMLSSGGCRLCTRCAREAGMPCRQRGKMRYSLESLGCDVTRLVKDKLGIELLWAKDRLPEYLVLVNGMLIQHRSE